MSPPQHLKVLVLLKSLALREDITKDIEVLCRFIDEPSVVENNGPELNRETGLGLSILLPSARDPQMLLFRGGGGGGGGADQD